MRAMIPQRMWTLVLGLPLACGAATNPLFDEQSEDVRSVNGFIDDAPSTATPTALKAGSVGVLFPGAGTSGAARSLSLGLGPETSGECNPVAAATEPASATGVQTVCFFGQEDPGVPAAAIEQVVEILGNDEWVHIRLTMNPNFVDNTYGDSAIGWASRAAGGPGGAGLGVGGPGAGGPGAEPKPPKEARAAGGEPREPKPPAEPPVAGEEPPPPAEPPPPVEPPAAGEERMPPKEPMAAMAPPGDKAGHTFGDLVGSDHTEMLLLDGNGDAAVHFRLDYLSAAANVSGYASLGVEGGEGRMVLGEQPWILASTSSMDRNLNACGLAGFEESSPVTDAQYTPNPDAGAWDYRVSYEVWVSVEAFGAAGFGSALIENVHASPSKAGSNTLDVLPAPCPVDPSTPEAQPEPLPPVLTIIR